MDATTRNDPSLKWKPTLILAIAGLGSLLVINFTLMAVQDHREDDPDETITHVEGLDFLVYFKNGTIENVTDVSYSGVHATVFSVTNATFSIEFDAYPNGYFITSINGAIGGWTYKVNGTSPGIAANFFPANNRTTIDWVQVS